MLCAKKTQTNLSQKHLTNENFSDGLSKYGQYVLDFLDFLKQVGCFIKFLRLYDAQNSSK